MYAVEGIVSCICAVYVQCWYRCHTIHLLMLGFIMENFDGCRSDFQTTSYEIHGGSKRFIFKKLKYFNKREVKAVESVDEYKLFNDIFAYSY